MSAGTGLRQSGPFPYQHTLPGMAWARAGSWHPEGQGLPDLPGKSLAVGLAGSCYLLWSSENWPQLVLFTITVGEVSRGSREGNEVQPLWEGSSVWQQHFLYSVNKWKPFDEEWRRFRPVLTFINCWDFFPPLFRCVHNRLRETPLSLQFSWG